MKNAHLVLFLMFSLLGAVFAYGPEVHKVSVGNSFMAGSYIVAFDDTAYNAAPPLYVAIVSIKDANGNLLTQTSILKDTVYYYPNQPNEESPEPALLKIYVFEMSGLEMPGQQNEKTAFMSVSYLENGAYKWAEYTATSGGGCGFSGYMQAQDSLIIKSSGTPVSLTLDDLREAGASVAAGASSAPTTIRQAVFKVNSGVGGVFLLNEGGKGESEIYDGGTLTTEFLSYNNGFASIRATYIVPYACSIELSAVGSGAGSGSSGGSAAASAPSTTPTVVKKAPKVLKTIILPHVCSGGGSTASAGSPMEIPGIEVCENYREVHPGEHILVMNGFTRIKLEGFGSDNLGDVAIINLYDSNWNLLQQARIHEGDSYRYISIYGDPIKVEVGKITLPPPDSQGDEGSALVKISLLMVKAGETEDTLLGCVEGWMTTSAGSCPKPPIPDDFRKECDALDGEVTILIDDETDSVVEYTCIGQEQSETTSALEVCRKTSEYRKAYVGDYLNILTGDETKINNVGEKIALPLYTTVEISAINKESVAVAIRNSYGSIVEQESILEGQTYIYNAESVQSENNLGNKGIKYREITIDVGEIDDATAQVRVTEYNYIKYFDGSPSSGSGGCYDPSSWVSTHQTETPLMPAKKSTCTIDDSQMKKLNRLMDHLKQSEEYRLRLNNEYEEKFIGNEYEAGSAEDKEMRAFQEIMMNAKLEELNIRGQISALEAQVKDCDSVPEQPNSLGQPDSLLSNEADDIADSYKQKASAIFDETKDVEEQIGKLKLLRDEIDAQIKSLIEKKERINMNEMKNLVQKIDVQPGTMTPDNVQTQGTMTADNVKMQGMADKVIEAKIANTQVEIQTQAEKVFLSEGDVKAEAMQGVSVTAEGVQVGGNEVGISPKEAVEKVKDIVQSMKISDEDGTPTYQINTEKNAKFLGILPVKMQNRISMNAQDGEITKEEKPFWAMLATEDAAQ